MAYCTLYVIHKYCLEKKFVVWFEGPSHPVIIRPTGSLISDYITLHYRHIKRHLHLKWPVVHQQLHVIQNTVHRPSTQASYTASRVRPKRKISCAVVSNCSKTHNIFSSMAPHEFSVILRTTTDEFNVLSRTIKAGSALDPPDSRPCSAVPIP